MHHILGLDLLLFNEWFGWVFFFFFLGKRRDGDVTFSHARAGVRSA